MKVYFDTNVLVSALQSGHIHHVRSFAAFTSVQEGAITGCLSNHGLVELYSVLTRTPFVTPVYPSEIRIAIEQTIVPFFKIIDVSTESHLAAIALCANAGWRGGKVHDAVHIQAAAQAGCDRIYTYDIAHFQSIAPEWSSRIESPPRA